MQTIRKFVADKGISLYQLAQHTGKANQSLYRAQDTWGVIETPEGFLMCNITTAVEFTLDEPPKED